MKKLVVFGDSYVDLYGSWTSMTALAFGVPLINYGHAATSIAYSLGEFNKYATSSAYHPEDIIIFAITSQMRLHASSMPSPALSVGRHSLMTTDADKEWLRQNLKNLEWAQVNLFDDTINYEILKILAVMQSWASAHPSNLVVALKLFPDVSPAKLSNYICNGPNFIPLVDAPLLSEVSMKEFITPELMFSVMKDVPDQRMNHLSACNTDLLASMITDVIIHRDSTYYKPSQFTTNIFLTKEDYENYENFRC